ncbi:VWA domain-containing protein [uncultured Paludibaculum sp.]|uniref:VWA domain-containing protein n=1 Tax=uncultured Paludibaculum sp. TaxID=1765020 RepID=UPI002AAA687B|nr:VWA domain-containing protein [uncultured Paludibaculum sp.]
MRTAITAIFLCTLAAPAQQVGGNVQPGQSEQATFTAGAQLVVETVTVTDKKGKPIEGLTAKDFTVTEDGVPQTIKVFEYQRLTEAAVRTPSAGPEKVKVYEKLGQTRIAAESPGDTRYKNRRLLALYFDMTAMDQADELRALAAAQTFIRRQMTADDLLAILRYSGGAVEVLQDFTQDRDRLLSILQTMIIGEGQGFDESTNDAGSADTGAAFGQDDSEFNIFNTDRQLSALQTAAKMLSQLSEKKALVYFSSGLRLNGMNNQAQLVATINSAIRAGVSFWPIDARGLVADPPMGDASQASPGNKGMYSGTAMMANTNRFQQSQDTLYSLAADTGGKALFDTNDLTKGIVQASEAISSYYVIGYYATNAELDGKFRRIKITLNGELSANLDYRQGYYAGKQFNKFTSADKERQLEDALMLPDPITELTIAMEIDYFQLNRAEYYVPVVVKIPGRELALAKKRGAERTVIDFIGEIKDSFGTTVMNVRDKVTAKLSEATAAELAKRPIVYDTGYTLLPGQYTIKFLARDAETGRIGTYETKFLIPNLNKEEIRLPISSVVLSSQRVDMKEALYNAMKEKDRHDEVNPLVQDGQKLIPSVTRVFNRSQNLYVYLHSYQQGVEPARPVVAVVSFYRGGAKVFESTPMQVTGAGSGRLKTLPIHFDIPLEHIEAGQYECQLTVLNPDGQRAAFWRAPILIVQ